MIASFIAAGQYLDIDDELYFLHKIVLIMLKYKYEPPPPPNPLTKKLSLNFDPRTLTH